MPVKAPNDIPKYITGILPGLLILPKLYEITTNCAHILNAFLYIYQGKEATVHSLGASDAL